MSCPSYDVIEQLSKLRGFSAGDEVKDYAKYVVGSEETEPVTGFDYEALLGKLRKNPDMTEAALAALIVSTYYDYYGPRVYPGAKLAVTMSAIDTSKLAGLAERTKLFAQLAMEVGDRGALWGGLEFSVRYTYTTYGDFSSFVSKVLNLSDKKHPKAEAFKAAAKDLDEYIRGSLVTANAAAGENASGWSVSDSKGVSIYLPPAGEKVTEANLNAMLESPYSDFAFDKATGWSKFVSYLYTIR